MPPIFLPPIDSRLSRKMEKFGDHAEKEVLSGLKSLTDQWIVFHGFEWRLPGASEERVGETDLIVFHPEHGVLFIEIKGGGIECRDGRWFYVSRGGPPREMEFSPFSQARRNHYAVLEKLKSSLLDKNLLKNTAITHTVWFPDIEWRVPRQPAEIPAGSFVLDRRHIKNPEDAIKRILSQAKHGSPTWTKTQANLFIQTLCPDLYLAVPVGTELEMLREKIFQLTDQQISVLRFLRAQKRLQVEGCAGSGKTMLAIAMVREWAQTGKKVLFTCYNRNLALNVRQSFSRLEHVTVTHFHELVYQRCQETGVPFHVPPEPRLRQSFFRTECAELLIKANEVDPPELDAIVVDEAMDFHDLWWLALESMGRKNFVFHIFFDRNQRIYRDEEGQWHPPFDSEPLRLEENLRNTAPVGQSAWKLGQLEFVPVFRVCEGPKPVFLSCTDPTTMGRQLVRLVREQQDRGGVPLEEMVVLSPYRLEPPRLDLPKLFNKTGIPVSPLLEEKKKGVLRYGTLQAFKGLEADMVILVEVDTSPKACSPANLHVGATRARSLLYVLHNTGLES
ncbi:MAG: DUF2075 domain-containing protein [Magnetococcales bacterium]|nr:DUF2075 domain-containing protein [Magnetococcales bacterium]